MMDYRLHVYILQFETLELKVRVLLCHECVF